jgi:hypothetical protein
MPRRTGRLAAAALAVLSVSAAAEGTRAGEGAFPGEGAALPAETQEPGARRPPPERRDPRPSHFPQSGADLSMTPDPQGVPQAARLRVTLKGLSQLRCANLFDPGACVQTLELCPTRMPVRVLDTEGQLALELVCDVECDSPIANAAGECDCELDTNSCDRAT